MKAQAITQEMKQDMNAQDMKILRLFFQCIYFNVPCIPRGNLSLETEFLKSLESVCSIWCFESDQKCVFRKDLERKICSFFNTKATL